jgi:hypothetical protein
MVEPVAIKECGMVYRYRWEVAVVVPEGSVIVF